MRKLLSVLFVLLLLVFVFLLAHMGLVALLDYWTGLAVALTLTAMGVLYWGWKPEINRSIRKRANLSEEHVSSAGFDTTKHQGAILANIVQTMSNLNLRYSRGEITREEYLKAKSDLQTEGKSVPFEAGIVHKKNSYRQGESVQLWAKYTGKLDKGYHVIQVSSLSGATLPKGQDWWSDDTTYHNPNNSGRVGRLIAPPHYEYKTTKLLTGFAPGEYRIVFEIGEGKLSEGKRLARATDTFVVAA